MYQHGTLRRMIARIGRRQKAHLYIEEWMQARGLSDQKMAERVGVERPTITRWRREQHRLNPEKIAALAIALDIEPEQLWRPPKATSIDALLKNEPAEVVERAADVLRALVRKPGAAA